MKMENSERSLSLRGMEIEEKKCLSAEMAENKGVVDGNNSSSSSSRELVVVRGGYNKEIPPEDDCCPICFGAFDVPCRTSCGHWFCASCILQYWRYSASVKQGKCPMCSSSVSKLVPLPALLIQPREEVGKILKDIEQYNQLHIGGWRGLFLKAITMPSVIRRTYREDMNERILRLVHRVIRMFTIMLALLYDACGFEFLPNGRRTIILWMEIIAAAIILFLIIDGGWYQWKLIRDNERRMAREAVQPHLE